MANLINILKKFVTGNRRYRAQELFTPQGIVVHSIGVTQPDADALYRYWASDGSAYVTHYVLDDEKIIQCMPDNLRCWHVGSPGNSKWIGVEMCEPDSIVAQDPNIGTGGGFRIKNYDAAINYTAGCYKNAVRLCAQKCIEYGWDPYTAVWTHAEITRKGLSNTDHSDPQHLWNGLGMGYDLAKLRNDVAATMNAADSSTPAPEEDEPDEKPLDQIYRIRTSWDAPYTQVGAYVNLEYAIAACPSGYAVYDINGRQIYPVKAHTVRVTASTLNIRKGPGTQYPVVNTIANGGVYTVVEEMDGWGLLKAYSANRDGWIKLSYTAQV